MFNTFTPRQRSYLMAVYVWERTLIAEPGIFDANWQSKEDAATHLSPLERVAVDGLYAALRAFGVRWAQACRRCKWCTR